MTNVVKTTKCNEIHANDRNFEFKIFRITYLQLEVRQMKYQLMFHDTTESELMTIT